MSAGAIEAMRSDARRRRELSGHVDGLVGLEHACQPGRQQRPEGALADGGRQA